MTWNCQVGYIILHIICEEYIIHIILLSAMEFVEFHEVIGGVFKEAILEKNFSKSKPF